MAFSLSALSLKFLSRRRKSVIESEYEDWTSPQRGPFHLRFSINTNMENGGLAVDQNLGLSLLRRSLKSERHFSLEL